MHLSGSTDWALAAPISSALSFSLGTKASQPAGKVAMYIVLMAVPFRDPSACPRAPATGFNGWLGGYAKRARDPVSVVKLCLVESSLITGHRWA